MECKYDKSYFWRVIYASGQSKEGVFTNKNNRAVYFVKIYWFNASKQNTIVFLQITSGKN